MAQGYAGTFCRKPQVTNLSFLNGLIVFLLPVALLVAPGEADFPHFVANFAFYAIFSAVIPTAMSKLMFVSEASQMAGDSMGRVLVGGVDVREMDPRVLMVCWPLAIAAFWSVPVAFAILFGTRKRMQPVSDAVRAEKVHVAEGIQETLECMHEIRATNQTEHYLAGLLRRLTARSVRRPRASRSMGCLSMRRLPS